MILPESVTGRSEHGSFRLVNPLMRDLESSCEELDLLISGGRVSV
jgi:hypothetical protein